MNAILEIEKKRSVDAGKRRPWWRLALEAALLPCVAVAGLELFFQAARTGEQEFLQPDLTYGNVHIPNKLVTWRMEGYSHDRLSPQGLRDLPRVTTKAPNVTRIALLGDSATEGMQVPLEATYGQALERRLNREAESAKIAKRFEVINFGCSGYSTGQQVLQYEQEVRKYHPDIVILMYNRGDNVENVFVPGPAGSIPPRPYFKLNDKNEIETDNSIMEMNADKLRPNQLLSFLRGNSRIFGVFSQQNLMLSINEPMYHKLNQIISKFQLSNSPVARNRFVKPSYPLQDPWVVTTKLLDRLRGDVKDDGAQFVLLLFPNSIQDKTYAAQEQAFETDSKARGYNLLALTPIFKAMPDMHKLYLQYHFSVTGHSVVAHMVHNYLLQQFDLLR
ncbi:MAG TPA: SGNH/GDSL hydrolase family protein [Oculatellaceae cyanobacterium]